jgi:sec-independent protein translocase protein TatA
MAPSIWQILLIVLVVLLIFGAGKIPQIMGDMAKGFKSFKKGLEEEDTSADTAAAKPAKSIEASDDVKKTSAEKKKEQA